MAIILASKSPRRRQLMQLVTQNFVVETAEVDEHAVQAANPAQLALKLAQLKAAAVFGASPGSVVVGCDTVVELDGAALGKPANQAEAIAMLTALAGRVHLVHTGVCIYQPGTNPPAAAFTETTGVEFAPLTPADIVAYAKTDEPYDKAGGYGIQGAAARFIPRINGCYYNVMGLPVAALYNTLVRLGIL
ncbi:Maf family protein [Ruminococcaceae bacterium OttesenSCG-928-A16]|nr:Maf family protein [Ruminococcaceae bacterium OttesenSCG-928-A16]